MTTDGIINGEIMNGKGKDTDPSQPAQVPAEQVPALRLSRLGHGFESPEGELTILHDIDLSVAPGESLAILGPSGSGKSTLLGLMAGLDKPLRGEIELLGKRIDQMNEDGRAAVRAGSDPASGIKQGVGFVFQSFQLLPALTALENVMLPLELAGAGAQARDEAASWLNKVGLGARVRHYPNQLSGGEQQRVALARAFAMNPAILFADEPTGNLDRDTGREVADQMFQLQADRGVTLILVTHDHGLAGRCQRRVSIDSGRLITNTHDAQTSTEDAA